MKIKKTYHPGTLNVFCNTRLHDSEAWAFYNRVNECGLDTKLCMIIEIVES